MVWGMDSRELAINLAKIADDRKAENIRIIEVRDISGITDFFVIVTGTSDPHVRAIAGELENRSNKDLGVKPVGKDGRAPTHWYVLDYFDVIVHIMTEDIRSFYSLESLWKDAPQFSLEDFIAHQHADASVQG